MHAPHWFIGCALCIAGIGSASAASLDSQDLDSVAHATIDTSSRDSGSGSGGDATGLGRDCPPGGNNDSPNNTSGNSNDRSGGGPAPMPTRQPHLGWQSLLPGSIQ